MPKNMDICDDDYGVLQLYAEEWPIIPTGPPVLTTTRHSGTSSNDGVTLADGKPRIEPQTRVLVPGLSTRTTVIPPPSQLTSVPMDLQVHPKESDAKEDVFLSSPSTSPEPLLFIRSEPFKIRSRAANKMVRFTSPPVSLAAEYTLETSSKNRTTPQPQLLPVHIKQEAPNTFRDFQRRYSQTKAAHMPQSVKPRGRDPLASELHRRKQKNIRPAIPAQSVGLQARTTATVPTQPYHGTIDEFVFACAYLEGRMRKNDTALHQSLWDDFVRFYTLEWKGAFEKWRRKTEEEDSIEQPDFGLKLNLKGASKRQEMMEPPLSMYCNRVQRPVYHGCVVSPQSLQAVLHAHPKLAEEAKSWIRDNEPCWGPEGLPFKRSKLWE